MTTTYDDLSDAIEYARQWLPFGLVNKSYNDAKRMFENGWISHGQWNIYVLLWSVSTFRYSLSDVAIESRKADLVRWHKKQVSKQGE